MPNAFLVVARMDTPPEDERELDEFCREEHFASLLSVPGVLSVRRFRSVLGDGPRHMIVQEIERPEVMENIAYKNAALTPRGERVASHYTSRLTTTYEEIVGFRHAQYDGMKSNYLWIARMDIPPEIEDEFNEWYDTEHVPLLLTAPGWMASRRFRRIRGDDPKYMTMYEIAGPSAREGEAYERTHKTDWYRRIRPQFRNFSSALYEQLYGLSRY